MSYICGVSKNFGEWYQKTNKTDDTNKLTLLAFKIIAILHNTQLATFIKLLETVSCIYFCLTCFALYFSPFSEAGVQLLQWFKCAGYGVSAPGADIIPITCGSVFIFGSCMKKLNRS
jgi:hypothetical protein